MIELFFKKDQVLNYPSKPGRYNLYRKVTEEPVNGVLTKSGSWIVAGQKTTNIVVLHHFDYWEYLGDGSTTNNDKGEIDN